jgi:hypothetical protein
VTWAEPNGSLGGLGYWDKGEAEACVRLMEERGHSPAIRVASPAEEAEMRKGCCIRLHHLQAADPQPNGTPE